jgi:hypothetical protein
VASYSSALSKKLCCQTLDRKSVDIYPQMSKKKFVKNLLKKSPNYFARKRCKFVVQFKLQEFFLNGQQAVSLVMPVGISISKLVLFILAFLTHFPKTL